jgi:C-terminal region of MMR_HSR1 domain
MQVHLDVCRSVAAADLHQAKEDRRHQFQLIGSSDTLGWYVVSVSHAPRYPAISSACLCAVNLLDRHSMAPISLPSAVLLPALHASSCCLAAKMVQRVMQEYKMHNADILFKEDASVDDLIDVLEVICPQAHVVMHEMSGQMCFQYGSVMYCV